MCVGVWGACVCVGVGVCVFVLLLVLLLFCYNPLTQPKSLAHVAQHGINKNLSLDFFFRFLPYTLLHFQHDYPMDD